MTDLLDQESFESTDAEAVKNFVGKHFIYMYSSGWQYELYLKNERTMDYRDYKGLVEGRWVKDQPIHLVRIADDIFKVSWNEPTGTIVSMTTNLTERRLHSLIVFPAWVARNPKLTVCFQNEHLDQMRAYRDAGPHLPRQITDIFADITFLEDAGPNDEKVISCSPLEVPEGYVDRRN